MALAFFAAVDCRGCGLAAEWGNLKGRFVLSMEKAPEPRPAINVEQGRQEVCSKHKLVNEKLES